MSRKGFRCPTQVICTVVTTFPKNMAKHSGSAIELRASKFAAKRWPACLPCPQGQLQVVRHPYISVRTFEFLPGSTPQSAYITPPSAAPAHLVLSKSSMETLLC